VNGSVNGPKISEVLTVVRTLEDKVVNEWGLVDELVDEEFNFIDDSNVVLLVLELDKAAA